MLRFDNRVELLDLRSDKFLSTLVQLGGYCTIGQAKGLGLANSDTRALAHLRIFEENGFVRRVFSYPSFTRQPKLLPDCWEKIGGPGVYTMTRQCSIDCWQVDFYLEDVPNADFVFEHEKKIAVLTQQGCPIGMIPQRGGGRTCGMNSSSK